MSSLNSNARRKWRGSCLQWILFKVVLFLGQTIVQWKLPDTQTSVSLDDNMSSVSFNFSNEMILLWIFLEADLAAYPTQQPSSNTMINLSVMCSTVCLKELLFLANDFWSQPSHSEQSRKQQIKLSAVCKISLNYDCSFLVKLLLDHSPMQAVSGLQRTGTPSLAQARL